MAMASLVNQLFFLLLLLTPYSISQTYNNISLGDSFPAKGETTSWVISPSGEFAFGFYNLPNTQLFLLAIWFDKIPEKTVVWSANRANPVQKGSRVELRSDGWLVLYDNRRSEVWNADATARAASAAMLNNGNFVLIGADSEYKWTSFQAPTDTILPTQVLELGGELSSRRTQTDYSIGRFQLRLQQEGNLVLNTISLDSTFSYDAYHTISGTIDTGYQMIFNESGYIFIELRNNSRINLTPPNMVSPSDFYHRAVLEFDGVFRQYIHPKALNPIGWNQEWSVVWSMPSDICNTAPATNGSGICGFNSYCELDNNQRPVCKCPPEYAYLDPKNTFGGCRKDFNPQSCELGAEEEFELKEMAYMAWPHFNYDALSPVNEDECRESCLKDCLCEIAVFIGADCFKKKIPLSNGRVNPGLKNKSLVKIRKGNSSSPFHLAPEKTQQTKNQSKLILIGSTFLGISFFLNLLFLSATLVAIFFSRNKRVLKHQQKSSMLGMNLHSFTYEELKQVTEGFKNSLGRGSFGIVYRGIYPSNSREFVAVKKLHKMEKEGEKEFETEVKAISHTYHKNLVHLIGYCNEGPHRLLVYEFMSNGSLESFIFGSKKPNWHLRKQIALGIARGLVYLHEECSTQIIHCDIKPQNILLDDHFVARISDFGLAKLLKADQTQTNTGIRGTRGYVAPEWFKKKAITAKVDVYSFGVLLLENICCRRNIECTLEDKDNAILTDWAWDCYRERRLDLLLENDLEPLREVKMLERFITVAIWCIQEEPSLRPAMSNVAQMLEGAVEVSVPPQPFSIGSLR